MAEYLSLEEAAKKLGVPTDKLVDMRSQGEVRGFRDGASWKFPVNEIERVADELGVDMGLDSSTPSAADAGDGSAILIDDLGAGSSIGTGSGSVIGGDIGSDLDIGAESLDAGSGGSDVNLVADVGVGDGGSDVSLVASDSSIGSNIEVNRSKDKASTSDLDLMIEDEPLPEIDSKRTKIRRTRTAS